MDARRWTAQEEAIVELYYGAEKTEAIARRIKKETGKARSPEAIRQHAVRNLGLTTSSNQPALTPPQAAERLGVNYTAFIKRIKKGHIKVTRRGQRCLIDYDEFERFKAENYPDPPARSVGVPEASRLLGIDQTHVASLLEQGKLRGVKRGRWRVDLDHIDELIAWLRRTGATRYCWERPLQQQLGS